MSSAASLACASDSAMTTAMRSPTCRTLPCASGGYGGSFIGWPLTSVISQPQGRPPTFAAAIDREHSRRFLCLIHGNLLDPGVRVRRSHERCVRLPRQRDIVGIHAGAGEEAVILLALDPRPDQGRSHSLPAIARAPAMMLLTILW